MPGIAALAKDDRPHFATVAGDGLGALRLAIAAEAAAGQAIVTRLTDPAPMFDDPAVVAAWAAAGLRARKRVQHLLERRLLAGETLPQPEPHGALVFRETPARVAVAPQVRSAPRIGASR